jgi:hypothetical protein
MGALGCLKTRNILCFLSSMLQVLYVTARTYFSIKSRASICRRHAIFIGQNNQTIAIQEFTRVCRSTTTRYCDWSISRLVQNIRDREEASNITKNAAGMSIGGNYIGA